MGAGARQLFEERVPGERLSGVGGTTQGRAKRASVSETGAEGGKDQAQSTKTKPRTCYEEESLDHTLLGARTRTLCSPLRGRYAARTL
jgi:hypothetical protein